MVKKQYVENKKDQLEKKLGKKLTLIKQKTIYNVRHYDLDDETRSY